MKKSKHSISSWLKKYGDPEVEKQVEEELKDMMEAYANQRVIETLEKVKMHIPREAMERVIKELKQ